MKVLVIGGGGREHALAWKLGQSPQVERVIAAPGNPGMSGIGTVYGFDPDIDELVEFAQQEAVDLVVIGPEAPLVAGLADRLLERGINTFGPGKAGARLEGSKAYAKEFMRRHGIPTAASEAFTDERAAFEYLGTLSEPPVVKQSGLAAGKGVTVASDMAEAEAAVRAAFRVEGNDGVLLEERIYGRELSLLLLTDGVTARQLPLAEDYKQVGDGDRGPMTGGMGAIAPADLLTDEQLDEVRTKIIAPSLAGLKADGIDYRGVLFIGLMITKTGVKVLEYNVRFGDPETQVVMPLLKSDLFELLLATSQGRLADVVPKWSDRAAACIVMCAPGYPGKAVQGIPLSLPADEAGVHIFHAGTEFTEGGQLQCSGGRVLNVVTTGRTVEEARTVAYDAVGRIGFEGAHWRTDIGARVEGPTNAV